MENQNNVLVESNAVETGFIFPRKLHNYVYEVTRTWLQTLYFYIMTKDIFKTCPSLITFQSWGLYWKQNLRIKPQEILQILLVKIHICVDTTVSNIILILFPYPPTKKVSAIQNSILQTGCMCLHVPYTLAYKENAILPHAVSVYSSRGCSIFITSLIAQGFCWKNTQTPQRWLSFDSIIYCYPGSQMPRIKARKNV